MTAGQVSDDTDAAALLDSLPCAKRLRGDRSYDAVGLRGLNKMRWRPRRDSNPRPRL